MKKKWSHWIHCGATTMPCDVDGATLTISESRITYMSRVLSSLPGTIALCGLVSVRSKGRKNVKRGTSKLSSGDRLGRETGTSACLLDANALSRHQYP